MNEHQHGVPQPVSALINAYLSKVRWAGIKGIEKNLKSMNVVLDRPALEAHLASSAEKYATTGGLWCLSHELDALHRHLAKRPKVKTGAAKAPRRPTLRMTQLCSGRARGGKCAKCGNDAEYELPCTTWGPIKLCGPCRLPVLSRPIGANPVKTRIIPTGMGTGRRS